MLRQAANPDVLAAVPNHQYGGHGRAGEEVKVIRHKQPGRPLQRLHDTLFSRTRSLPTDRI
eukprot:303856-Pyramimonas_sp.AAC.1